MRQQKRIINLIFALIAFTIVAVNSYINKSDTASQISPTPEPTTIQPTSPIVSDKTPAQFVKVVDGDTIDVTIEGKKERIRVIGINTPETVDPRRPVECFGREASAKAKELFATQSALFLEQDPTQSNLDRYGRLLRYIFFPDGTDYGKFMIEAGYALEYTYDTPYKYQLDYKKAQEVAQTQKMGLWADNACQ